MLGAAPGPPALTVRGGLGEFRSLSGFAGRAAAGLVGRRSAVSQIVLYRRRHADSRLDCTTGRTGDDIPTSA